MNVRHDMAVGQSLVELFAKYGTDKNTIHSYGPLYEQLLLPYRMSAEAVLEIGVQHGGSLRAWRDYFPNATIYGVDIDPAYMFKEERIETVVADQGDYNSLLLPLLNKTFDVVIDDGSHKLTDQILSWFYLWPVLKMGGIYCIEDSQDPATLGHFSVHGATVYDLRDQRDRYDNILLVWHKTQ
jgi:23S rRNA U2552 (ribose-2'-O)-methylase RlmE/FtsJ